MKKAISFIKPHILIALFIYIAVCLSLYIIQFIFFVGALKTVFVHALVYPPVFILSLSIHSQEDIYIKNKKLEPFLIFALSLSTAVFIGYLIYKDKYYLVGYQILAVLAVNLSLYIRKCLKQSSKKAIYVSKLISAIYLSVLVTSVAYLFIVKPSTVYKAENIILDEGYQNIYYVIHTQSEISLSILLNEKISYMDSISKSLGVYLFYCEKNNEGYGAFVDVASGRAILYEKLAENAVLSNLIELKQ